MLLECRKIKEKMLEDLKVNIKENLTLEIIQIGDFASNEVYLRSKRKLATLLNVSIKEFKYQEENTKEEIINKIKEFSLILDFLSLTYHICKILPLHIYNVIPVG